MDESLLTYYNRELAYIRKMGAEFAEKHPKIAGRLRLDQDSVEDPHVSRLIESFAFLTARIRHTIDDSFPELTESLISLMYPAYHAPLPSMSIIKCRSIPQVPGYQFLPKGSELLVAAGEYGHCRFRTCDNIDVLPVELGQVKFANAPLIGPPLSQAVTCGILAKGVLKVIIKPIQNAKIGDLTATRLRFFISAQPQVAYKLLDFMANKLVAVGGCESAGSELKFELARQSITLPNFDMLSAGNPDGRNDKGYQELTDYFVFPQKFLFFDVAVPKEVWSLDEKGFCLYFHFEDTHPELVQALDEQSLQLGCVPIVNLYADKTESIDASTCYGEESLRVQKYRHDFADIHTIRTVVALNVQGETVTVPPFYGDHQQVSSPPRDVFWHIRRENSLMSRGYSTLGTDTFISLVDKQFDIVCSDERWLVHAEVNCTNRDIPSRLPFGPNQPHFDFAEGGAGLRLKCMVPPTNTFQPQLDKTSRWNFIAQLGLQSFFGNEGVSTLKTALSLYDLRDSRETRAAINAIQSLKFSHVNERVIIQGRASMCVGLSCEIVLDETAFTGNSIYLFGVVLHRFFTSVCAINSFVKTQVLGLHNNDVVYKWKPTLGNRPLI